MSFRDGEAGPRAQLPYQSGTDSFCHTKEPDGRVGATIICCSCSPLNSSLLHVLVLAS